MKVNSQKFIPSWETALPISGPVLGTVSGAVSRLFGSLPFWENPKLTDPSRLVCKSGFGSVVVDGINQVAQLEVKHFPMAGPVFGPILAKGWARSEKTGIFERVVETAKKSAEVFNKEVTRKQKIAGAALLFLRASGLVKPALEMICRPIAPSSVFIAPIGKMIDFEPSGHFFTKIATTALGVSITKTLSNNATPGEKRALMISLGLNVIKDAALLFATLGNHCHSPQEAIAGSVVALAGIAGAYYLGSFFDSKEASPANAKMEIKAAGPNSPLHYLT